MKIETKNKINTESKLVRSKLEKSRPASKLKAILHKHADAFGRLNIKSIEDLHKALRAQIRFEKIPQSELEIIAAFDDYTKLFPPEVADALVDADFVDRQALLSLEEKEFEDILKLYNLDDTNIGRAIRTLKKLHRQKSDGAPIDELNELTLRIKGLEKQDIKKLKDKGIETLTDWALKRPKDIDKDVADRIDTHARLSHLNIKHDTTEILIDKAKIKSLQQLAGMSKKELTKIARQNGISKTDIFHAAIQARKKSSSNQRIMMAAKAAGPTSPGAGDRPDWFDDMTIDWDDYVKKCIACPDEVSIFSCLAYLIYLIQLTGKSLTDLKTILKLDFPGISGDSINQIAENPQIDCEQISVCEQMIRALQDYLNELKNNTLNPEEYQGYTYLPFQTWKANKMAFYYPELNALWRGDVLTGETGHLSHGSFLKHPLTIREHLFSELSDVQQALDMVRVFYLDSDQQDFAVFPTPGQFNNAALFKDAHQDHYNDFVNGLKVIHHILSADQAVFDAYEMLNVDDAGNSIFHLHEAINHLDQMAGLTFDTASNWRYLRSQHPKPYQALIESPPRQRREIAQQLFDELMEGDKPLFTPLNQDIVIEGLNNDGAISLTGAWINQGAFRDTDGKLEKYSAINSDSFVKYAGSQDYSRFTNYDFSASLTLDEPLTDGQVIALGVHLEVGHTSAFPKKGYLLAITQATEGLDGGGFADSGPIDWIEDFLGEEDIITIRQHVSLLKIEQDTNGEVKYEPFGNPVQIGFKSQGSGIGSSLDSDRGLLQVGQGYPMTLRMIGNQIVGELKISETRTISVQATDAGYPNGTFGFSGSEQTQFTFDNIKFEIEGADSGFPPFHARRRTDNRNTLDRQVYKDHRDSGTSMAVTDLANLKLTDTFRNRIVKGLTGLKKVGSNQFIGLLFNENSPFIRLELLDDLLEHCLISAFYMRYAVIPVKLSQAYTLQGNYQAAIDHLKLVYDDHTTNETLRGIYPYLTRTINIFTPVAGADQKLMRLRLGEAYIKQADLLFRQNTASSKYEAKQLFERVLALHNETNRCECDERLGEVIVSVLKNIYDRQDYISNTNISRFIDLLNSSYQSADPLDYGSIFNRNLNREISKDEFERALETTQKEIVKTRQNYRNKLKSNTSLDRLRVHSQRLLEEAEVRTVALKNRGQIDSQYHQFNKLKKYLGFNNLSISLIDYLDLSLCIPQNPFVLEQTKQSCLMLDLIENCINILGYKDDFIPTQRFDHLFSLSSNFAEASFSAERDVLNFRQLLETNVEQFIQSENNVVLNDANVSLEALNIEHTLGDITLLELQKSQTEFSRNHFNQLITNGLSGYEELALNAAKATTLFSGLAAAGGIISAASAAVGTGMGASGNPAGIALAAAGIAGTLLGGAQGLANFSSSVSNLASMQASFERREQEWQYNLTLNEIGIDIANQNIQQGFKRLDIVRRQHEIAQLRLELAKDSLSYLENKFLNKEMLTWMLRLSREQYRLRLNYAIASSFMAEQALAFELLSPALKTIRFDYFEPVRDGLLGATQLLTDLKTLQVTKLNSEKRKLQLSRTLSLAELAPAELQSFKSSGILPFSTLLRWFDKDFPGHYQRLISKVSISMLALVPPHQGIKAMLRNSGISSVVIGPPYRQSFTKQTVTRNPEAVALTSAIDASGIISFQYQDQFLLPFEGLGVETDWILEMPQASNPFDYNTIADIFFNIEYTALHSYIYAANIRQMLGDKDTNNIPITPRLQYPDEWYHFKNDPVEADGTRIIDIVIPMQFLPPNYDKGQAISTRHVTIMLTGNFDGLSTNGQKQLLESIRIEHAYQDNNVQKSLKLISGTSPQAGEKKFNTKLIQSQDNQFALFSTRDNNNLSFQLDSGIDPIGEWRISVKDIDMPNNKKLGEYLDDILVVVTTEGQVNWG